MKVKKCIFTCVSGSSGRRHDGLKIRNYNIAFDLLQAITSTSRKNKKYIMCLTSRRKDLNIIISFFLERSATTKQAGWAGKCNDNKKQELAGGCAVCGRGSE